MRVPGRSARPRSLSRRVRWSDGCGRSFGGRGRSGCGVLLQSRSPGPQDGPSHFPGMGQLHPSGLPVGEDGSTERQLGGSNVSGCEHSSHHTPSAATTAPQRGQACTRIPNCRRHSRASVTWCKASCSIAWSASAMLPTDERCTRKMLSCNRLQSRMRRFSSNVRGRVRESSVAMFHPFIRNRKTDRPQWDINQIQSVNQGNPAERLNDRKNSQFRWIVGNQGRIFSPSSTR
jgi:hypothetical protein